MNILHMKYAVEVARLGSLNKAAEVLLIAQPNISRSIKELEASLGITIFKRSAKGMVLTSEGEEFIGYAREILRQIEDVELLYRRGAHKRQRFSICTHYSCYVSEALTEFSSLALSESADIFCRESTPMGAVEKLLENNCNLALVRYAAELDRYYKDIFEEKALTCEMVAEFSYVALMSDKHPLAKNKEVTSSELCEYAQVTHSAPTVPSADGSMDRELSGNGGRIVLFDRAAEYDILACNNRTFMLVSPVSEKVLGRHALVQKRVSDNNKIYKDMLLYRNGYKLSKFDNAFITALCCAKRNCMS